MQLVNATFSLVPLNRLFVMAYLELQRPFQGRNTGSIPVSATNPAKIKAPRLAPRRGDSLLSGDNLS